jgi:SAM-dependent methyltransferase
MPDRQFFPEEIFTVVQCNECGLGFVNPRPAFQEMQKYYPPQYYDQEFVENPEHHQKRYAIEAGYLGEPPKIAGEKRLLDVGCANGDFPIFMMARGWNVEGVEVSISSRPIEKFKVYHQPFPDIPVHQPVYDAVTAWAVLEHVHDPMAYFRKASAVLKPGGLFVFLVTNFNSLASRRLFCEDVPRHLYFFTEETVNRFLQATGFKKEEAHYRGNIYRLPPANWLSYWIKTRVRKRKFMFEDLPFTRSEYIARNQLKPGLLSTLKFALHSPVKAIDSALLPVIEMAQTFRKTYGITTYVARKL